MIFSFMNRLKSNAPADLPAGFSVFMIALPLSIGIAVASGAPPTAGIIASIVGGVIGACCNGSRLAINGPAAGLIVIVYAAIAELGHGDAIYGFKAMLACVVIAGIMQTIMGALRLGTLGLLFPVTVVHGMLAAIGLIIISKQIHVALGVAGVKSSPIEQYLQVPHSFLNLNPAIAVIGTASLVAMLVWNKCSPRITKIIPPPLAAILVGAILGYSFDLNHQHLVNSQYAKFSVGPEYQLAVPTSMISALNFPDFGLVGQFEFWKHVLMICLVATAESILSTCAVDKLDPERRRSDLNRELMGKGIVNTISGLLGGLPIITEIVRSSANVTNGAKSQLSNFLHGVLLLVLLLSIPDLLHQIPLASLAMVLIVVEFRLASPKHFMHAFKNSKTQGLIFVLTITTILATDLLIGVLAGTLAELCIFAFHSRSLRLFSLPTTIQGEPEAPIIKIEGSVGFTNYLVLRSKLDATSVLRSLTLDLRNSPMIDDTVKDHLDGHIADFAAAGKELRVVIN